MFRKGIFFLLVAIFSFNASAMEKKDNEQISYNVSFKKGEWFSICRKINRGVGGEFVVEAFKNLKNGVTGSSSVWLTGGRELTWPNWDGEELLKCFLKDCECYFNLDYEEEFDGEKFSELWIKCMQKNKKASGAPLWVKLGLPFPEDCSGNKDFKENDDF